MDKHTGRCMCGDVTFEATPKGTRFAACYCKMCQRWSAGAFMGVHVDAFELTSAPETLSLFRSSDWASRAFCGKCGSNIYYHSEAHGGPSVALGAFDDTSGFEVRVQFFIDQKPDGFALANETRALTGAELAGQWGGS